MALRINLENILTGLQKFKELRLNHPHKITAIYIAIAAAVLLTISCSTLPCFVIIGCVAYANLFLTEKVLFVVHTIGRLLLDWPAAPAKEPNLPEGKYRIPILPKSVSDIIILPESKADIAKYAYDSSPIKVITHAQAQALLKPFYKKNRNS